MNLGISKVWIPALVAIGSGCAEMSQPEVSSLGPQTVHPLAPGALAGPYVPSGTLVSVRLVEPLDTYYTKIGTRFTATVLTPLRDPSGRVLVARGAQVHGTFVSFGPPGQPHVQVALQSIDTVAGPSPLYAAIRSAQHIDWSGPPDVRPWEPYPYPSDFHEHGTEAASRWDPAEPDLDYEMTQPQQVRVPTGALVELQLTEPLVVPAPATRYAGAPVPNAPSVQPLHGTFSVVKVDPVKRELVLEQRDIGTRALKVGPGVDLSKLEIGQRVAATYYPEVALAFRSGCSSAPGTARQTARSGATAMQAAVTEDVVAVDDLGHTVTVRGPSADTHIVRVTDPALQAQLEGFKAGQPLWLTYTPALVVSVEPAESRR